ncbi:hypothetical protein K458DRAFT_360134 [Lentithecium fluviatile CBS 122367]|uniref:Uncharacterized protein n=1 Tax=Lentithecium fluviatile CBS 122367 TaxID=1168545 RepID=A0A6G1JBW0_9PLEO|nr:hypothetical protein K458DRAFT_360134 [Lentithecium fluviatile CBS 122367]
MANETNSILVPWHSGPKERGGYHVVWSCLALIFTCTWTTLHLNVPGLNDTSWVRLKRKVKWMAFMIVFPEFVFARALVELKSALDDYLEMVKHADRSERLGWCIHPSKHAIRLHLLLSAQELAPGQATCREHKRCLWTLTHNLSANMGVLVTSPEPALGNDILLRTGFHWSPSNPDAEELLEKNHFTKDEILDKSKADTFVRVLWSLQMMRLVLDLSVRAYERYPVTPLEIMTASFTALSFITVIVQAQKPLDVRKPLYLRGVEMPRDPRQSGHQEGFMSFIRSLLPNAKPINDPERIHNDYYRSSTTNEALLFSMLAISTVLFGLIHLGAWHYEFPSPVEQWVWRVAVLLGVVFPLPTLILRIHLSHEVIRIGRGFWGFQFSLGRSQSWMIKTIMGEYIITYTLARLALIVIALISFRSAPRGIYLSTWADFIPTIQ